MLTAGKLKGLFAEHGFRPLKRLGENYLIDGNIRDKIIRAAHISKDDTVIEIGPGFGALTLELSKAARRVTAVEKDKKAFPILKSLVGRDYPNLDMINGDILDFDLRGQSAGEKIKIVGNLPYYITTPIIELFVDNRDIIESALVVIQKEVAERIAAAETDKNYGAISCFVRYYFRVEKLFTIKSTSFFPLPEVDSAAVSLTTLKEPPVKVRDAKLMFRLIRGSFNQRRKSIINSLARKEVADMPKEALKAVLERAGVDPSSRPEDLSLGQFAAISDSFG